VVSQRRTRRNVQINGPSISHAADYVILYLLCRQKATGFKRDTCDMMAYCVRSLTTYPYGISSDQIKCYTCYFALMKCGGVKAKRSPAYTNLITSTIPEVRTNQKSKIPEGTPRMKVRPRGTVNRRRAMASLRALSKSELVPWSALHSSFQYYLPKSCSNRVSYFK
jgi:hypothetical protein